MGTRGPIGERDADRRRRNKPDIPTETAPAGEKWAGIVIPPEWHSICSMYYEAIQASGITRFYEPSDWVVLYDALEEMDKYKRGGIPARVPRTPKTIEKAEKSGATVVELDDEDTLLIFPKRGRSSQMRLAIDSILTRLMVTEGDRRRLRIELEREDPNAKPAPVVVLADYKAAL